MKQATTLLLKLISIRAALRKGVTGENIKELSTLISEMEKELMPNLYLVESEIGDVRTVRAKHILQATTKFGKAMREFYDNDPDAKGNSTEEEWEDFLVQASSMVSISCVGAQEDHWIL